MTDLTLQTMWQDAPAQSELRKAREARADRHWHPTTPVRSALMLSIQAAIGAEKKDASE